MCLGALSPATCGNSTWSGLASLGGTFPAYPAALAGRGGYIWVVAEAGGNLYADYLPTGSATWSGWTSIGNPGTPLTGTPAIVQDTNGNNHVFVRTTSGTLYTNEVPSGSTTWTGFTSLGGTWPDDVAAITDSGGYMFLFAVGATAGLYDNELPPGGSWSGWNSLGSGVIGVPAVIQDQAGTSKGTNRVFVRSTTGPVEEDSLPGGSTTWSGLVSRTGVWQNDPVAYAGSGGSDWVYAIGTTTSMYYDKLTNGTWSDWTSLGGAFTGTPGVSQDSSAIHLFSRSTSGTLEEDHLPNSTTTWSGFASLGGPVAGH